MVWDANGNPLSITDSVNGTPLAPDSISNGFDLPQAPGTDDRSYSYDSLNRLTKAVSDHYGTRRFRYDPLGNLRHRHDAAPRPDITYHYGSLNRLTTTSIGFTFGYDGRGNVTTFGPATLGYNHANEIVSYNLTSPSRHVTYAYDARGWRVKTTANGTTTYFVYDANHHLIARQKNGTLTEFIHLGSRPIARIEGTTTTWIHTNYQHSPLFETDANGSVTRRPFYLAYGVTTAEGRSEIPGYAGSAPDTLTDLSYMGARYYYPLFARFLSPDPAPLNPTSPMGLNRYTYAAANPARFTDPTGRCVDGLTCATIFEPHVKWRLSHPNAPLDALEKGAMATAGVMASLTVAGEAAGVIAAARAISRAVAGKVVRKSVKSGAAKRVEKPAANSRGAKPSPKFKQPTNSPQLPPTSVSKGIRLFRGKPTKQYSNGYWKIEKFDGQGWQRLDPRTMKPGAHPDTHVPFPKWYKGPFDN